MIMANKLVYSWADKLWHMNPIRKHIATRYASYISRVVINQTMDRKRNLLAILTSPIVGWIFLLLVFFIVQQIEKINPKEMDGPMIGDGVLYYFFIPILFVCTLIFQVVILEPIFRRIRRKEKLNKQSIKKLCVVVISALTIIISLPMTIMTLFGTVQFEFIGIITEFIVALAILSLYFIPNMITYYNIYIKKLSQYE